MSIMHGIEYIGYIDPWTDEERLSDEEVVRCMDCKWFDNDSVRGAVCRWFCTGLHDDYDGFCAWGERRTNSALLRLECNSSL